MNTVATAPSWETVIGLEVHAQLAVASKMYCACPAQSSSELSESNRHVCPVCLGHPGALPRPNRMAVLRALTLARKAGCEIAQKCAYSRKNYFYPDLPKGYQISQYDRPLAQGGAIPFWHKGEERRARLVRIHIEEDTAKLFHLDDGGAALDYSRGGIALLELVTRPDFRGAAECVSFLDELRSLLRRLGVSEAAMEAGNMRCEPNVSVRPVGSDELRTKTELKNLNSFVKLRKAVESEVARQIAVYESGGTVYQETLRWDAERNATVAMRRKESADDYRYFDDPDIPPLYVNKALLDEAGQDLRSSAFELRRLMVVEDGLAQATAAALTEDETLYMWYRLCCQDGLLPRTVANWVTGELTRLMREAPLKIEPGDLTALLRLIEGGRITQAQAKSVFEHCYLHGKPPHVAVEELGLPAPVSSSLNVVHSVETVDSALRKACQAVIDANPKVVADIRAGKAPAVMVLVGQVMKATKGSADPEALRAMLEGLLGG
jgi:aspartyl-tRNA(Asn)/glutamyl-tRNA(Gln) amidotransferase subunit B